MEITYHKIRNVDKSVCTCEQKIAYNLAWAHAYDYREKWRKSADKYCRAEQSNFIHDAVQWCMKFINEEIRRKYDVDGIFAALNAGMENYFNADYGIMSSYEEVGKCFPANYLN